MKKMTVFIASLLTCFMVFESLNTVPVSAEAVIATRDVISKEVMEEIEGGALTVPVIIDIRISAQHHEEFYSHQQETAASEEQCKETINALWAEIDEAAEKLKNGELSQNDYDVLYRNNYKQIDIYERKILAEKDALRQEAKELTTTEFQDKLTLWDAEDDLLYISVIPEICVYSVCGKLTPAQIMSISNDEDVESITLNRYPDGDDSDLIITSSIYGDFNHDGEVNASDAAIMLIYAAEHGAGTFSGSFDEYVNR